MKAHDGVSLLSIWCEGCNQQYVVDVQDAELGKSLYVVCQNCGWETAQVWCPKCEMGGQYVDNVEKHPDSWICDGCDTEYLLPPDLYDFSKPMLSIATGPARSFFDRTVGGIFLSWLLYLVFISLVGFIGIQIYYSVNNLKGHLVGWLFSLIGFTIMILPMRFFKLESMLNGSQMKKKHPRLAWVRWGYPIALALWFIFMLFSLIKLGTVFSVQEREIDVYMILGGAAFASVRILNGLFAILAGAYPVEWIYGRNLFVCEDNVRRIGWIQIAVGISVSAAAILAIRAIAP